MNNNNSSTILNIIIITLIVGVLLACYIYSGKQKANNPNSALSDAEVQSYIPELSSKELKPFEKYNFRYTYTITWTGDPYDVSIKIPVPQNDNEKQYISSLNISPKPNKTYQEAEDTIAEFFYPTMPKGRTVITISGVANVRTYDYTTAQIINKNLKRENNLSRYLVSEDLIESNDPMIKQIAQSLRGKNQEETIFNVVKYINKTMKYVIIPQNIGAKQALIKKQGKCAEYAAIMVALLRANGIPSRLVLGNLARDYQQAHVWVEVYYNNYGWVTYDPADKGATVNLYNDKKQHIGTRTIIHPEKNNMKYIASQKNTLTPITINYHYNGFGQLRPLIKTEISKVK